MLKVMFSYASSLTEYYAMKSYWGSGCTSNILHQHFTTFTYLQTGKVTGWLTVGWTTRVSFPAAPGLFLIATMSKLAL